MLMPPLSSRYVTIAFSLNREQFAQLIGYSVCGFCGLSYASDEIVAEINTAYVAEAQQ